MDDTITDNSCLLLTEFEVCTVSYEPSFFPLRFMAQPRSVQAISRSGKNEDYSTYQEDKVSKIFIICLLCVWWVQEKFPFMRNGFKFLTRSKAKQVNLKLFLSHLHALVRNSETVICFIRWENLLINHTTVWQQKYFKF